MSGLGVHKGLCKAPEISLDRAYKSVQECRRLQKAASAIILERN